MIPRVFAWEGTGLFSLYFFNWFKKLQRKRSSRFGLLHSAFSGKDLWLAAPTKPVQSAFVGNEQSNLSKSGNPVAKVLIKSRQPSIHPAALQSGDSLSQAPRDSGMIVRELY